MTKLNNYLPIILPGSAKWKVEIKNFGQLLFNNSILCKFVWILYEEKSYN